MDIAAWLQDLGLQRYVQAFRDNDIDAEVLLQLTAEDLISIGVISVGHRRKLLDAIASLGMAVAEVETPYYARAEGSLSKLNTLRDGFRILWTIVQLYRAERPLPFFSMIGIALGLVSVGLAIPIIITFLETHTVPRLPTAVLSTGLMVVHWAVKEARRINEELENARRVKAKITDAENRPTLRRDPASGEYRL